MDSFAIGGFGSATDGKQGQRLVAGGPAAGERGCGDAARGTGARERGHRRPRVSEIEG
jgi:hypothetical protein